MHDWFKYQQAGVTNRCGKNRRRYGNVFGGRREQTTSRFRDMEIHKKSNYATKLNPFQKHKIRKHFYFSFFFDKNPIKLGQI